MILQIVLGALIGTSLMTAFSYIVSRKRDKQFREPQLINELISRAQIKITPLRTSPLGWILHYLTGTIFTLGYYFFWKLTAADPSLISGAVLGAVNGVLGISVWVICFVTHSNPPDINLKDYYWHLMIAHIIFGFGVALGFLLPVWLK
ncbi:MAG TPA: hypothetical protein VF181_07065 [Balneolaceae bacterium]